MNATGNFDAALQLAQPALGTVLSAMHRAGSATHAVATVSASASGGDVVELLVNVPAVALDTTGVAAPPSVEARTSARILYHSRPVADPASVGVNAACDVTLRAAARIGDGQTPAGAVDPATVVGDSYLFTDYTATLSSDIAVHGVSGAAADEARDSLLNVILAQRGTYPLAILDGSGIAQIGGAVIDRSPDTPLAAVGLNFAARAGASSTPDDELLSPGLGPGAVIGLPGPATPRSPR